MNTTLTNAQTLDEVKHLGEHKAKYTLTKTYLLGFMGGFYIALAATANLFATFHIPTLGKIIGAGLFPIGLMLVVLIGGSLFTGDVLQTLALSHKQMTLKKFVANITAVWLGNFTGALFMVLLATFSYLFEGQFEELVVHTAEHKLHLDALTCIASGFLCNILVAGGVWFALVTKDLVGKILAIWLPVMMFVFCGYQHVVANMFYINMGIVLDPSIFNAKDYINHFIFVSIGNFLSGGIFLPFMYKAIFKKHH